MLKPTGHESPRWNTPARSPAATPQSGPEFDVPRMQHTYNYPHALESNGREVRVIGGKPVQLEESGPRTVFSDARTFLGDPVQPGQLDGKSRITLGGVEMTVGGAVAAGVITQTAVDDWNAGRAISTPGGYTQVPTATPADAIEQDATDPRARLMTPGAEGTLENLNAVLRDGSVQSIVADIANSGGELRPDAVYQAAMNSGLQNQDGAFVSASHVFTAAQTELHHAAVALGVDPDESDDFVKYASTERRGLFTSMLINYLSTRVPEGMEELVQHWRLEKHRQARARKG